LRAPVTFGGRLDTEHATGPLSRWMGAEGPLSGDFRDWDRIRAWASDIAQQLDRDSAERQQ
jgi:menaquinone-dependent protoporphyrinogen oxidase